MFLLDAMPIRHQASRLTNAIQTESFDQASALAEKNVVAGCHLIPEIIQSASYSADMLSVKVALIPMRSSQFASLFIRGDPGARYKRVRPIAQNPSSAGSRSVVDGFEVSFSRTSQPGPYRTITFERYVLMEGRFASP